MQEQPGLRERKRIETRRRIVDAALDLALERGVEQATVEAISAAAGGSARTFFNYFDSKDDALLGLPNGRSDAEVVAEVVATATDLTLRQIAARLVAERIAEGLQTGARRAEHLALLKAHPHLFAAAFRRMTAAQDAFADALRSVAADRGVLTAADPAWADVLIAATGAAARAVMKEWATAGRRGSPQDIEQMITTLLTTTWENLT